MADNGDGLVIPPPPLKVGELHYPILVGMVAIVLFTSLLIVVTSKFDQTHGALTISLIIVLTFCGAVAFCLFFTIPQDTTTAAITGGLVSSIGAIVAFWLGKQHPPADGGSS